VVGEFCNFHNKETFQSDRKLEGLQLVTEDFKRGYNTQEHTTKTDVEKMKEDLHNVQTSLLSYVPMAVAHEVRGAFPLGRSGASDILRKLRSKVEYFIILKMR
jgi:hypothetical protein